MIKSRNLLLMKDRTLALRHFSYAAGCSMDATYLSIRESVGRDGGNCLAQR